MERQTTNLVSFWGRAVGSAAVAVVASALSAASAHAVTFNFTNITGNSPANALSGESQLSLDVTASGSDKVLFKFSNKGPAASSITQIYFDDVDSSRFLKTSGVGINDSGAGVNFDSLDSGGNLPGGNTVKFDEDFNFKAKSPVQPSGVNPGEWVEFLFSLNTGKTFNSLIDAITAGAFDIGFHVQGFANGGSESFVIATPT
ncbi:MAG: hypothetical protein VKL01_04515, partial [Limnothrix sp.]|nr:hypothetical protein [Limnothrix sp.]